MSDYEVEFEMEGDGRWIADIPAVPGAMAYGLTKEEASAKAHAVARHLQGYRQWRYLREEANRVGGAWCK